MHVVVMGIGVLLIFLSAFGVAFPIVNIFEAGAGLCFASMLIPPLVARVYHP